MPINMDRTKSLSLFAQWHERFLNVFKEHLGVYLLLIFVVTTEYLLSSDFTVKIFFQAIFSGVFETTSFFLIYVFIPQKIRKFYGFLLVGLYELDFLIALISYGFYGKVMVSEICVLVLSTNVKEASEFFTGYIHQLDLSNLIIRGSCLLLIIHVVAIVLKRLLKRQTKVVSYISISLYGITLLLLPTQAWLYANSVPLQIKAVLNTFIDLSDYVKPVHLIKTKDNQWVILVCSTNPVFWHLCDAMERPDWLPKYEKAAQRLADPDPIMNAVIDWIGSKTWDELKKRCDKFGVPVCKVMSMKDIFADPQYKARNNILEVPCEEFGTVKMPGICPVLSETPGEVKWAGQKLGFSNEEIYKSLLGLSDIEIAELKSKKII